MRKLFAPERRRLVAKGLMTTFGLTFSGFFLSDLIWKTGLNIKVAMGIMLVILFMAGWLICPTKKIKEEET